MSRVTTHHWVYTNFSPYSEGIHNNQWWCQRPGPAGQTEMALRSWCCKISEHDGKTLAPFPKKWWIPDLWESVKALCGTEVFSSQKGSSRNFFGNKASHLWPSNSPNHVLRREFINVLSRDALFFFKPSTGHKYRVPSTCDDYHMLPLFILYMHYSKNLSKRAVCGCLHS